MLAQWPDIDGIFAAVKSMAMSSYEACRNLGRQIPADVKVISFSNLEIAALLTAITQPAYNIGREAAHILFQSIIKNRPLSVAQSQELKSKLIIRASTASRSASA